MTEADIKAKLRVLAALDGTVEVEAQFIRDLLTLHTQMKSYAKEGSDAYERALKSYDEALWRQYASLAYSVMGGLFFLAAAFGWTP